MRSEAVCTVRECTVILYIMSFVPLHAAGGTMDGSGIEL